MICIYCHSVVQRVSFDLANTYQGDCICGADYFIVNLNVVRVGYALRIGKTTYAIDSYINAGTTNFYVNDDFVISFDRLFWVFPETMPELINKFKKLIPLL